MKNKYATFTGRARRKEFWMYFLVVAIIEIVLSIILSILGLIGGVFVIIGSFITVLFGLAIIIPTLALWMRRLHDTGKSGWWLLINIIPVVGSIVLLIFALLDSQPGDNKYGPNPKGM